MDPKGDMYQVADTELVGEGWLGKLRPLKLASQTSLRPELLTEMDDVAARDDA